MRHEGVLTYQAGMGIPEVYFMRYLLKRAKVSECGALSSLLTHAWAATCVNTNNNNITSSRTLFKHLSVKLTRN